MTRTARSRQFLHATFVGEGGESSVLFVIHDATRAIRLAAGRGRDESGRKIFKNLEGWTPHLISKDGKKHPVNWVIECGGDTFAVSPFAVSLEKEK